MVTAIYAGSFDPITNGHIDIIKKSSLIFDKVIVAIAYNINKSSFLPLEDRKNLITESVKNIKNVEVDSFAGLTVDYAKKQNISILIRGLRNTEDFSYELEMSHNNEALNSSIQTIFLPSKPELSFISSSSVREILKNGGDISQFVPEPVKKYFLKNRF